MRLFISYSHKDEALKDQLVTHLKSLERDKLISSWDDRKIQPGSEWEADIDRALEAANIIVLLISPDFLASAFCYEKEMLRAIERHDLGDAVVVPIILRPSDWRDKPFGKIQGLPRDGRAITKWDDADEAWLDVILALKEIARSAPIGLDKTEIQKTFFDDLIRDEFSSWLDDTEVELKHRMVDRVRLSDVFVSPDLRVLEREDIDQITSSITASDIFEKSRLAIVFGDEQSGKSTLAKHYFAELLRRGRRPVLLQGHEIKLAQMDQILVEKANQQYRDPDCFLNGVDKAIIVDDFSSSKLNCKYQDRFVSSLKEYFQYVILFASDSYQYVVPEVEALEDFSRFEVMSFGNLKRTELIEKWVSMGNAEQIEDTEFYAECDEAKLRIESMTRGGILPSKPIFLLSLLQMFESISPQKVEMTSYGHCYQYLIYQALDKAKVRTSEVDSCINMLTELGFFQFKNEGFGLDDRDLERFVTNYENEYLGGDSKRLFQVLLDSGILIQRRDRVSFRYAYIYYFFAAKKLAESFANDKSARAIIQNLLDNLHREDCANIIIFITHHSRDYWVLDEIQLCLMSLFDDHAEADLGNESLEFMFDFLKEIPDLVLEHRKVEEERREHDRRLQEAEEDEAAEGDGDNGDPSNLLAKINRTFKGIEIIGQIIRNRHGSLGREKLEDLAAQAYGVGLRFLDFFLEMSDSGKEEVVHLIKSWLREKPSITNERIEKEARSIFLLLTYGAIFSVLQKVSNSVGSKEAEQIYRKIEIQSPSPAVKLINQAIYLQFNKNLDAKALKALADEFKANPVCERMLKEIVIQHIYMFPVEYAQKQQIAEILQIPVAGQVMIGRQKSFKM